MNGGQMPQMKVAEIKLMFNKFQLYLHVVIYSFTGLATTEL